MAPEVRERAPRRYVLTAKGEMGTFYYIGERSGHRMWGTARRQAVPVTRHGASRLIPRMRGTLPSFDIAATLAR